MYWAYKNFPEFKKLSKDEVEDIAMFMMKGKAHKFYLFTILIAKLFIFCCVIYFVAFDPLNGFKSYLMLVGIIAIIWFLIAYQLGSSVRKEFLILFADWTMLENSKKISINK